jgi:transposase
VTGAQARHLIESEGLIVGRYRNPHDAHGCQHTAKRIYERLKEEHRFGGGYTIVKDYVRDARLRHQEVFVPLAHPLGDG